MKRLILVTTLVLVSFAAAVSGKSFRAEINEIYPYNFPKIEVTVKIVTQSKEQPVAENFKLEEEPYQIATFTFAPKQQEHYLMMLIDRSSSIESDMPKIKKAAALFAEKMVKNAQIAVMSFGSDIDFNQQFTQDFPKILKAIKLIRPWGGTSLYDGLYQACDELEIKAGRDNLKTIVCLTDGRDSTPSGQTSLSIKSSDEVIEVALRKNVRIITVSMGEDRSADPILKSFARKTKGWCFQARSADQLESLYLGISKRMLLEKYYRISYESPDPELNGTLRKIKLQTNFNGEFFGHSHGYRAPTKSEKNTRQVASPSRKGKVPFTVQTTFLDLKSYKSDNPALDGKIEPPASKLLMGLSSAAFSELMPEEIAKLINHYKEKIGKSHAADLDQKNAYLKMFSSYLNLLFQENEAYSNKSGLTTFDYEKIEFRRGLLNLRFEQIELYRKKYYDVYLAKHGAVMGELDFQYAQYVQEQKIPEEKWKSIRMSEKANIDEIEAKFKASLAKFESKKAEFLAKYAVEETTESSVEAKRKNSNNSEPLERGKKPRKWRELFPDIDSLE